MDMYDNTPNQGMGCIRHILEHAHTLNGVAAFDYEIFETRHKGELPKFEFDLYIATGGPGSPYDEEEWEKKFFLWLDELWNRNQNQLSETGYFFAICHSFQLMCRHFGLGEVEKRKSISFGIMPIHMTVGGENEVLYEGLPDPFYAADFRDWQVIQPNHAVLSDMGAVILSLEKIRPHVQLERAITGIRLSEKFVGVQFHPEADVSSLKTHFTKAEQKNKLVENHGVEKYQLILETLDDPNALSLTERVVFPNLLRHVTELMLSSESLETSVG